MSRLGIDYRAVLETVRAAVRLDSQHVLLGVGSVVEGLGTSKSDLDLLLISAAETDAPPEVEHAWTIGRRIVDLRVIRWTGVRELLCRLGQWASSPWDTTRTAGFSYDERLLLHRLLHGWQLFPLQQQASLPFRPPHAELARLKLQAARHLARTIQVDLVGYRDNADYPSVVFAAQELLGHAVDGLLAGHRVTNPTPKWRSRLLGTLAADWSRSIATRWARLPADQLFWQLHRAPAEPDREPVLAHATRCVSFARAVFAWAEPELATGAGFETVPLTWGIAGSEPAGTSLLCADGPAQSLPALELDVDFRIADGRAGVGRLNEFGGTLALTPAELTALLLFDGETTTNEAARAWAGGRLPVDPVDPVDLARLIAVAEGAGLCRQPFRSR